MNEKHALSSDQIQARLKNLQQSAGHQDDEATQPEDVEITIASLRDGFDLKACQALLNENGIASKLVGRGFNQFVVVSRDDSSRSIDVIAAHRDTLLRASPLSAGDYVVGIVAWSLGCGLLLPCFGIWFLMTQEVSARSMVIAVWVLFGGSLLLGGFLGYVRCRAIASRKRR